MKTENNLRLTEAGTTDNQDQVPFAAPGDHIKAVFGIERMWLEVIAVENGVITGILANEPFDPIACGIDYGDTAQVNQADVMDVLFAGNPS